MTGFAFPEVLMAMYRAAKENGDYDTFHAVYVRYLPLIVFEQRPGVVVCKEFYRRRGCISHGHVRRPAPARIDSVLNQILMGLFNIPLEMTLTLRNPLPLHILVPE
jgi:4-hydroxy-tetrahydrodipicolinate synthase